MVTQAFRRAKLEGGGVCAALFPEGGVRWLQKAAVPDVCTQWSYTKYNNNVFSVMFDSFRFASGGRKVMKVYWYAGATGSEIASAAFEIQV